MPPPPTQHPRPAAAPSSTPGAAPSPPRPAAAPSLHVLPPRPAPRPRLHARLRALAYTPGGRPLPPRPSSTPGAAPSPPRPAAAPLPEPPRAVAAAGGSRSWGLRVRDVVLPAASGPLQLPGGGGGGVLRAAVPGGPAPAGPGGPIFFYCGNEGDIAWFAANSGLVWDAAPRFSALVVFAEHRYYGESLPFGSKEKAYNNSKSLAYLTAEQALADYAVLLTELKRNLSAEGSPVVLFGGSYGGMLAAWMRLKYPHIAVGALASSAPILQFEDIVPSTIFYDLVSDDFKRESVSCFQTIKDSWKALDEQGNGQDGLLKLSKTFHLCQTLKTTGDLSDWLSSAYSYLAMVDYPMPSDFLMPLPANPIKEVCRNIDNQPEGTSTLERIYAGVNIYYNYTGTVNCFDLDDDPHGMGGWDWQACTEMVMPMSYSEGISMFPPYEFNYASYAEGCVKSFGVRPRPRWVTTEFGGHNISTTLEKFGSNIVFFNGLLDPWSGGGVLKNISGSVIAIVAPLGAHHIDLRPATKEDPDWLVGLRESELEIIAGWLSDYYGARGPLFQRAAAKGSAAS